MAFTKKGKIKTILKKIQTNTQAIASEQAAYKKCVQKGGKNCDNHKTNVKWLSSEIAKLKSELQKSQQQEQKMDVTSYLERLYERE